MLHLYALFEEYIHILCICTVYIRGTCSLSGGMCGLQHTERIHTAKTKSPGPFREPSGPERVPGFVFALYAGKWPARRAPCGAQQFLLGLGQLFQGILPGAGRRAYPRTVPDRQNPRPLWHGCTLRRLPLWWARRRAAGSVVQPVYSCTACTAHHIDEGGLWPGTAQMRPLFFKHLTAGGKGGFLVLGGDEEAAGVAEADARDAALLLNDLLRLAGPALGEGQLGLFGLVVGDALGAPAAALAGVDTNNASVLYRPFFHGR